METLALIISIIALIIAVIAYQKVGGVADLKKQTEVLTNVGDTIVKATDALRNKTADLLDKMEGVVRGTEETKEKPKSQKKK
jgi:cell shape-determining protein MreC